MRLTNAQDAGEHCMKRGMDLLQEGVSFALTIRVTP